jgi:Cof subfamily protein (haloacid dehalogenase superfamily)
MNFLPNWNSNINELVGFSQIKLIVSDIDGTLLKSGNRHNHNKLNRIVKHLRSKGVCMTFATGRAFNGVKELIQYFPITKSTPLILYNGSLAIIPESETIIFVNTIENSTLRKLIILTEKYDASLFAYFISLDLFGQINLKDFEEQVYMWGNTLNSQNEPNGLPVIWNALVNDKMTPLAVIIQKPENMDIFEELLDKINEIDNISFTKSSNRYIEIRPMNSHKGSAIERICDKLDIKKNEVLAIGDNDNDVEMFEYAGVSVAVNNSSKAALAAGKFRSPSDDILGVIETLELVRQAHRYIPVIKADMK